SRDWSSDVCSSDLLKSHLPARIEAEFVRALNAVLKEQRRGARDKIVQPEEMREAPPPARTGIGAILLRDKRARARVDRHNAVGEGCAAGGIGRRERGVERGDDGEDIVGEIVDDRGIFAGDVARVETETESM